VILSSSAYKYQRRNQQPGGNFRRTENRGGGDFLRKRGTPGGAKIFGGGENGRKQGRRAEEKKTETVREWGERQRPRER
jgi:hypothetical protein